MNEQESVAPINQGSKVHVLVEGAPLVFTLGMDPGEFIPKKEKFVEDLAELSGVEIDSIEISSINEKGLTE